MNTNNIKILTGEYVAKGGSKILINLEDISANFTDVNNTPAAVFDYCRSLQRKGQDASDVRKSIYGSNSGGVNLSELFKRQVPFCRERSVLAHIMLAQIGIPSVIVSASSNDSRHSFVLYKDKKGNVWVLDAEKEKHIKLGANEKYGVKQYSKDIVTHILVTPKTNSADYLELTNTDSFYLSNIPA